MLWGISVCAALKKQIKKENNKISSGNNNKELNNKTGRETRETKATNSKKISNKRNRPRLSRDRRKGENDFCETSNANRLTKIKKEVANATSFFIKAIF